MTSFLIQPFNCFLLLVGLNSFLSYTNLSWPFKLVAGLLGFGTLGWFYLKNQISKNPGKNPIFIRELFTPAARWMVLAIVLGFACRLYTLTSLLTFPLPDEIINAYNALHMKNQWAWNFFYYRSQMPPFTFGCWPGYSS